MRQKQPPGPGTSLQAKEMVSEGVHKKKKKMRAREEWMCPTGADRVTKQRRSQCHRQAQGNQCERLTSETRDRGQLTRTKKKLKGTGRVPTLREKERHLPGTVASLKAQYLKETGES